MSAVGWWRRLTIFNLVYNYTMTSLGGKETIPEDIGRG